MAFTTGTSDSYADLLIDLEAWLSGTVGWTTLEHTPATLEAKSVDSVAAGGSGYNPGDTITLTGGTFSVATVLQVDTVSSGPPGPVATASIVTAGVYTVAPADPVAQGSSSGGGTSATFNMTYDLNLLDVATLSVEGPGNGADGRVYVNIDTPNDEGNNFWAWRVYGATEWIASTPFGSLPNASPAVYFNLWDSTIDYWFYGNDRRFIVIAKVGTNYMSLYAGFMLPLSLPSEYMFPHCIIASYPELALPSVSNARNSSIADPGQGAAHYLKRTTLSWSAIENQGNSASSVSPVTGQRTFMWPHKTGRVSTGSPAQDNWAGGGFEFMKLNANDESPLVQCHIVDMDVQPVVGALDGVFSTTGFSRSAEQAVAVGGRDFRLFQRAFRNSPGDFFAVEET